MKNKGTINVVMTLSKVCYIMGNHGANFGDS